MQQALCAQLATVRAHMVPQAAQLLAVLVIANADDGKS